LPGYQDDLISAVAAVNPNTIIVLNTGKLLASKEKLALTEALAEQASK